jgi:hypothetical protein
MKGAVLNITDRKARGVDDIPMELRKMEERIYIFQTSIFSTIHYWKGRPSLRKLECGSLNPV